MAKIINITDKLDLSGNPYLVIGDAKVEVNADAATAIKIIGKYKDASVSGTSMKDFEDIYNIIFSEESREKLSNTKLSLADFKVVIEEAVNLVMDEGETDEGEVQTHTTT